MGIGLQINIDKRKTLSTNRIVYMLKSNEVNCETKFPYSITNIGGFSLSVSIYEKMNTVGVLTGKLCVRIQGEDCKRVVYFVEKRNGFEFDKIINKLISYVIHASQEKSNNSSKK